MATDTFLLDRMRNILSEKKVVWTEKRMFGGDCFMVDDKMVFGTYKGGLMARVAPEEIEELTTRNGAEQMVHGGRPMKGYLFIEAEGYDHEEDLSFWIQKCLDFNPRAKSSKKKKKA
jgi:TfoX/Sxy family transcriptional regulator of competence genes